MIGQTVAHYTILDKLGEGGMGEVWRAEDTRLGRQVAIKLLPEAFTSDSDRLARFEREARVLATFEHPRIASIYGLEDHGGRKLLVMQVAEGETLAELIDRGPVPVERALKTSLQIVEALEAAHDKGIVHRDLKPGNIKITDDGQVTVLDFGLAKALQSSGTASGSGSPSLSLSPTITAEVTSQGVLLGTAAYMSPEQARGESVDRRADIWAFGVVLMEMLTGRRVYAGKTLSDTLAGVLARDPQWNDLPSDTPAPIRRLLERCLEKEASQRLQAIGEARIVIESYLEDPTAHLAADHAAEQPVRWQRLLPWAVAGAAAIALVAVVAVVGSRTPDAQQTMRLEVSVSEDPLYVNLGAGVVLSPDGTKMVHVADREQLRTMSVRSLDQLEGTLLVSGPTAEAPYNPFFSPDGNWIGFVTPSELKKVPVTGGTPIRLAKVNRSRGASWGPDDLIVIAPERASGLFTVPGAGGEFQPLTTVDTKNNESAHRWPQVVPGGWVIFTTLLQGSDVADEAVIEAVSLSTGERKVLHRGGSYGRWVPSGHLVYVRENTIFARPFDVRKMETTGSPAPIVQGVTTSDASGGAQISFSDTGLLAYVSGAIGVPRYPVKTMDRVGVVSTLWEEPGTYANPRLSPDGRRLSMTVLRDGNWDVWVYDLERKVATRLTFHDGYDGDQVWSPDGEYIAFSSDRDGRENPYIKRADGSGEAERLAEIEHDFWAYSWTPDGKWLLGEIQSDSFDLVAVATDGSSEVVEYLATEFFDRFPAISPDGRWLAYMSEESGRSEIYVRPFPFAAGKWQVSDGGGSWPSWSHDGSELIYRTQEGLMSARVTIANGSFRSDRPRPLASGGLSQNQTGVAVAGSIFSDYEITPDGQSFVILQGGERLRGQNNVTLVTNWFKVLRDTFSGS